MRDARFVATLAGLLFLDNKISEYEQVIGRAQSRNLPVEERRRIGFDPSIIRDGKPIRMDGMVTSTGSFTSVTVAGYPRIHCQQVRASGKVLRRGMGVELSIMFNAEGAIGRDLIVKSD
jgi:hypothetical protein